MDQQFPIKLSCIIDDDDVYINLIQKIITLKKLSEKVLIFKNGQEALNYFTKTFENPDKALFPEIILLDLNMPVMDGWHFLSEFSKVKPAKEFGTALYIISSSIDKEEIEKAKSFDMVTDYLVKPVDLSIFEMLFKTNRRSA